MTKEKMYRLISECWDWLNAEMGTSFSVSDVPVEFFFHCSDNLAHPYCITHWKNLSDGSKEIQQFEVHVIQDRAWWQTYTRKSAYLSANMIQVSPEAGFQFQVVHELTHVFEQWKDQDPIKGGEVTTTRNEIKFAFDNYYSYYKQCKPLINKNIQPKDERIQAIKCVN